MTQSETSSPSPSLPRAQMPPAPTPPARALPAGACDAHVHLVGAPFPLWDRRVEDPADDAPLAAWLERYRTHLATMGFERGLIVHSILYGTDNAVTEAAVEAMGPGFKGVGLLGDDASDADLDRFVDRRLVAVRLNYVHGGVLTWGGAKAMAPRLAERGLHVQMLLHSHLHMDEIADDVRALPCSLVIDHLGWPDLVRGVDDPGFRTLLALLAEGHVHLKLSALYRLCPPPYDAAAPFVAAVLAANPDALLWGSDWPHLMLGGAAMPSASALLDAFDAQVNDDDVRRRILVETPARLFGL
ncbi:MAG: amidohydrolase family protein [Shimia sp.]